ncbi:MAG TPA: adenylate/guanylate cyclase domain-containing protein [Candidatus Paceibacterota bacterium]|nr:adenylate/guanylate cyclase domain-containing protein [Verrucomicrobiota bacterium]HSA09606.1 adenylate/guanylate cyclase domain-containing protein [Candidatus Paceibacterota bacterium]
MKRKPVTPIPALIAFGIIVLVGSLRWCQLGFFEGLERMTYDMRVRQAFKHAPTTATNLGFVAIEDASAAFMRTNQVPGYQCDFPWPRQVYGRLIEELAAQGARAIALDLIFGELRPDDMPVQMADGRLLDSDAFLALQMQRARNVILAVPADLTPPALFLTNALALGDISTQKDSPDGVLRRAQAFRPYRKWHFAFRQVEAAPGFGVDLRRARVEPGRVVLCRRNGDDIIVPLDEDGNFDLTDFGGEKLPPGVAPKAKPFTEGRHWHMGIVLAAQELGLDLDKAEVDLAGGKITLQGAGGVSRVVPVDGKGYFYIDWALPPNHPQLTQEAIHSILWQDRLRLEGRTTDLKSLWQGKLIVVGSSATGNNLTDQGATPLREHTLLVSQHWNVANSIIVGRFIRRASMGVELGLVGLFGIVAALLAWRLRVLVASVLVASVAVVYIALSFVVYVQARFWLPLVFPVAGSLLLTHLGIVTWRVVFEQAERRRVKSIFSKIVSPKIVNELLDAETLSLVGARREITVFFADVRGFTELTDSSQERIAEYVRENNLTGAEAEACFDEQAKETLGTINLYLGVVADTVIKHDGTLDKFIGDCVMAFWGAPTPSSKHALACVRAAIEGQRAIYQLNQQRSAENRKRESENMALASAGLPQKPLLPILLLGSGINTGMATVGLMGSAAEMQNYTVFGREVNLASRLESASGRGRIFIGQTTYEHLRRDDPALAATCVELPPRELKGFRAAVKVYEVLWRPQGVPPPEEGSFNAAPADTTSSTGFIQPGGG